MPRYPSRLLAPALIASLCLAPTLASARPVHRDAVPSVSKRPVAVSGFLSQIRDLFSALWAETGSGLDPDGGNTATNSGTATLPPSDAGSILDPDG
jgi:hypothetical protein